MLSRAQSISLILLTAFSICIGIAWFRPRLNASSARIPATHPSASAANRQTAPHPAHFSKSLDRDSPFATYNNPHYAVSFRYPRTFPLTEDTDDFGGDSALKTQQQLADDQPGVVLLASVEIPDDAYPNTTFLSGHLQFAINPTLSESACSALASAASPAEADLANSSAPARISAKPDVDSGTHGTTGAEAIHGLVFHWRQTRASANNITSLSRDYFAYSNSSCYEFFLQVAATVPLDSASTAGISSAPDATRAVGVFPKADSPKILRTLEKSVSTFQLHYN